MNAQTIPSQVDKSEIFSQIRAAKNAHMRWRAYALALVSGVEISDDKIPVKHTECTFGRWYHGKGRLVLGELDAYEGIAAPHEMLHAIYERIYRILQDRDTESSGGLSRLLSTKAARERKKYAKAREHLNELIGVSDTLLKALEMLEQEVREFM